MSEQSIIGLRGPDFTVPIERGAIRQFARSLYSTHPEWMDREDAVVPPTFLVTAGYHWGYILERPPAGSELETIGTARRGTTDGGHSFEFFGPPPRAGDRLTASTEVADHYFKTGRTGGQLEITIMRTDFRDQEGRLAARWMPTSIRTEKRGSRSFEARDIARPYLKMTDRRCELDQITAAAGPVAVGDTQAPLAMPGLTLTEMIRYQCASGEDSPGHHDTLAARAVGFPDFFSVGMHHAGILGVYAAHWLGPEKVRKFNSRFLDMIWPGDVLTYQGRISGVGDGDEGPTVDVELFCLRNEVPVVRAWATFVR